MRTRRRTFPFHPKGISRRPGPASFSRMSLSRPTKPGFVRSTKNPSPASSGLCSGERSEPLSGKHISRRKRIARAQTAGTECLVISSFPKPGSKFAARRYLRRKLRFRPRRCNRCAPPDFGALEFKALRCDFVPAASLRAKQSGEELPDLRPLDGETGILNALIFQLCSGAACAFSQCKILLDPRGIHDQEKFFCPRSGKRSGRRSRPRCSLSRKVYCPAPTSSLAMVVCQHRVRAMRPRLVRVTTSSSHVRNIEDADVVPDCLVFLA